MDNDSFKARCLGNHAIRLQPYWSMWFVRLDSMHVIDHHGVCGIVCAGVLLELVRNPSGLGATVGDRLAAINRELKLYQSQRMVSSKFPAITRDMLCRGTGWAELKGPLVKAANTRHLTPFVAKMAATYAGADEWGRLLVSVCNNLCKVHEIMYRNGFFFPPGEYALFSQGVRDTSLDLMRLRTIAEDRGQLLFQITPKCHYFAHFKDQGLLINPRWVSNYMEESIVGMTTKTWASCAQGPYQKTIQRSVLLKYLCRWCLDMGL